MEMDQDVSGLVETALDVALSSMLQEDSSVEQLSDEALIQVTAAQMDDLQGKKLTILQRKQREGELTSEERVELLALMQAYNFYLVRKAKAYSLAVERGLIAPLSD